MKNCFQQIKMILLSVFILSIKSYAFDFQVDSFYFNVVSMDDMYWEITYESSVGNTYTGDIVIPDSVNFKNQTFSVVGIGKNAFYNCSGLKSIKLPKTIIYLNHYAFQKWIQQGLQAACSHVQPYVNVMIMILLFTSAQHGQLYHTMLQWHNVSNSKGYLYVEFS